MHFKFDHNINPKWAESLIAEGHTASGAEEEGLADKEDGVIAEVCRSEKFCLITADMDFAQILDYPPVKYSGLIVLRHPHPTLNALKVLIQQVAVALRDESPNGRLWIVEPNRIRIYIGELAENDS